MVNTYKLVIPLGNGILNMLNRRKLVVKGKHFIADHALETQEDRMFGQLLDC